MIEVNIVGCIHMGDFYEYSARNKNGEVIGYTDLMVTRKDSSGREVTEIQANENGDKIEPYEVIVLDVDESVWD